MSRMAQPLFTSFAEARRETAGRVETAALLALDQSAGRSRVDEVHCPAGAAIGSVGDAGQHRYLYVLEGDWTVVIGGEPHVCAAGTTLVAPRGMSCGGSVTGDHPGRLLVLIFSG